MVIDENIKLPDTWQMKTIQDAIVCDFGDRITQAENRGTLYPVYGGGDISFYTDDNNRNEEWVIGRFAISPTCVRFVHGKFWLMDSGFTFHTVDDSIDYNYAGQYLSAIQPMIYQATTQTAQKNLDQERFQKLPFPVPPLPEQERIASILGDLDDLIEKQHKIIDKKKRFRDGLKTELIANADGEKYALSDIATYVKGSIPTSSVPKGNYVSVESLLQNVQGRFPMNAPATGTCTGFRKGDTLLGNIRPYLKKIALADGDGGTNGDVLVIRSLNESEVLPEFLYYALSTNEFFDYNSSQSVGTKMPRGDKAVIMDYKITVSVYDQQLLISDTLSDIDNELDALIVELNKAKELKAALLRQLITGEIRTE